MPRVFWVNVITEMLLGQRAKVPQPEAALLRMADAMAETPSNVSDERAVSQGSAVQAAVIFKAGVEASLLP